MNNRSQKGAINVLVAIGISAFLGLLALTVDLGWLYYNKSILDGATEAAALSAGYSLTKNVKSSQIKKEVLSILGKNGIYEGEYGVIVEVDNSLERVSVDVQRNVKFFIAPIFGVEEIVIYSNKKVKAEKNKDGEIIPRLIPPYENSSDDYAIIPIGIPSALWQFNEDTGFYEEKSLLDEFTENKEYILKLGTEYINLSSSQEIDYVNIPEILKIDAEALDSTEISEETEKIADDSATALGDIVPWGLVAPNPSESSLGLIAGQKYLLKLSAVKTQTATKDELSNGAITTSHMANYHGNFGAVSLGGNGGNVYRDNIKFGYQGMVYVGMKISTEPGNMVGPTSQGLDYRFENNKFCVRVPIIDTLDLNGRKQATILAIKRFVLSSQDSTKGWVFGTFTDDGNGDSIKTIASHSIENENSEESTLLAVQAGLTVENSDKTLLTLFPKNAKTSLLSGFYTLTYQNLANAGLIPELASENNSVEQASSGFDVDGNDVTVNSDCDVTLTILGSQFGTSKGQLVPIGVTANIGDTSYSFNNGKPVHSNSLFTQKNVPVNTPVTVTAFILGSNALGKSTLNSWNYNGYPVSYNSSTAGEQVYVLKNGDVAKEVAPGFPAQLSLNDIIAPYVNKEGVVTIGNNEVLYLFDFNPVSKGVGIDYQDMIVLASANPPQPEALVEKTNNGNNGNQGGNSNSKKPVESAEQGIINSIQMNVSSKSEYFKSASFTENLVPETASGTFTENFEITMADSWYTAPAGTEAIIQIDATMAYTHYVPRVQLNEEENTASNTSGLLFDLTDKQITLKANCDIQATVLGSQFGTSNGYTLQTSADLVVDGNTISFNNGNPVNSGGGDTLSETSVSSGSTIHFNAKIVDPQYISLINNNPMKFANPVSSEDNNNQVLILVNGDSFPEFKNKFRNQLAVSELSSYINNQGIIELQENEILYLFDFNIRSTITAKDYQDMVILVKLTPQGQAVSTVETSETEKIVMNGYEITFLGSSYNSGNNTTSFTYQITGIDPKFALSHFTIGLPEELTEKIVSYSPLNSVEIGKDPTSGIEPCIKWDFGIGKTASQIYRFSISGKVNSGNVSVCAKCGNLAGQETLPGPGEIAISASSVTTTEEKEETTSTKELDSRFNVSWTKASKTVTVTGYYTIIKLRSNFGILDLDQQVEILDPIEYLSDFKLGHQYIYNPPSDVDTYPLIQTGNSYLGATHRINSASNITQNQLDKLYKGKSPQYVWVPVVKPATQEHYTNDKNYNSNPNSIYNYWERDKITIQNYALFLLSTPKEPLKENNQYMEFQISDNPVFGTNGELRGTFVKYLIQK